jgi:hypothetical protein
MNALDAVRDFRALTQSDFTTGVSTTGATLMGLDTWAGHMGLDTWAYFTTRRCD